MKKKNFSRPCPTCGNLIWYSFKEDYKKAERNNTKCMRCCINKGKFVKGVRNFERTNNASTIPKCSLNNLLNLNNLETFYWVGFILADGSFYQYRFEIALKASDKCHIEKLCRYLQIPIEKIIHKPKTNSYRLHFSNRYSIPEFMHIWHVQYRKTYNPCNFNNFNQFTDEQLFALLIGIIDGDGCIDKAGKSIQITCHESWFNFYDDFFKRLNLHHTFRRCTGRQSHTINFGFGTKQVRQLFDIYLKEHHLPILERKWNRLKI